MEENAEKKRKDKPVKPVKPYGDILGALNSLYRGARHSRLRPEFFETYKPVLDYLSGRLGLSPMQSVIFACALNESVSGDFELSDIAFALKIPNMEMLEYIKEVDDLLEKDYFRSHDVRNVRGDINKYWVPSRAMRALADDEPYEVIKVAPMDTAEFFQTLAEMLWELATDLSYRSFDKKMTELFFENRNLPFLQRLKSYGLSEQNNRVVLVLANKLYHEGENSAHFNELDEVVQSRWSRSSGLRQDLQPVTGIFARKGILEPSYADGFFGDGNSYSFTREALDFLFDGIAVVVDDSESRSTQLIKSDTLPEKALYYTPRVTERVDNLSDLLTEENYQKVQKRLREKGFREGFSCLFYGAPGTGKTETALQMARKSGRDILLVSISDLRSKCVGDSEKNVRGIFQKYRALARKTRRMPILLFNEADAVLGTRFEHVESSSARMENTLQNIILEEMEKLSGILIATKNLTQSLDRAFERRFLYKLKFEEPDEAVRQKIWQGHIPSLSEFEAETLAEKYNLTGGQIENAARRLEVDEILYGEPVNRLERLFDYCADEETSHLIS